MPIKSSDRGFVYEMDDGNGDEMTVVLDHDDEMHFEIDEPWAGSTETGFGATTSIYLPRADAIELVRWMAEQLGLKVE
jgi:hypothetical protein